MAHVMLELK